MKDFIIRKARREDCPGIIKLVKLANFEGMPDEPKIGADALQRDGFDQPDPLFKCIVVEPKEAEGYAAATDGLVGYALYCNMYSTWNGPSLYLEDIFVVPEVRNKGVGSALFDYVADEAHKTGCCRLDFVVLGWNPAIEFYKRKGAIDMTKTRDWNCYRLDSDALAAISKKLSEKQIQIAE